MADILKNSIVCELVEDAEQCFRERMFIQVDVHEA